MYSVQVYVSGACLTVQYRSFVTEHAAIPYCALKYCVHCTGTEMSVHAAIPYCALKYGVECTGTEMLAVPA